MTQEKDEHQLLKLAKGFFPHVATPAMLITALWFGAKFIAESEGRQLDSPEQKVIILRHVESAPSEVDNYKAYKELQEIRYFDSINKLDAIKSRAKRDSLFKLQATTIYQMKETQQKILEKIEH